MKAKSKRVLKWLGLSIGTILIICIGLGIYFWLHLPKPHGNPPVLQSELFMKPAREFPVAGKYIYKSATELAGMIRNKEATSLEITTEFINYIKNNNYRTNAFVWLFEEEALENAKKADVKIANGEVLGLLHGVPVCIKEQIWLKGKYSTINSAQYQDFIATENAQAVEAWISEGAIVIGTTNIPALLTDLQTMGDLYPRGNNPYDTLKTCGGSTGGGAAAVASGFCPLSLGGDMGGSIRVPSAFCGIYGLKTTENAIEGYGTFPDTSKSRKYITMAVVGPQARTIEDIDLAWKALIKPWYNDHQWLHANPNKKLNEYKVAWFDSWHFDQKNIPPAASLQRKMQQLVTNMQNEGVTMINEEPGNFAAMRQLHWLQAVYMIFHKQPWLIRQLIKQQFKGSLNTTSIDLSEANDRIGDMSIEKYQDIRMRRDTLSQALDRFFNKYDFLILPVTPGPAIKHNPNHDPIVVEGISYLYWDYFHYPMCFNLTGHPALTVPLGLNEDGLPIAVQIVGPMFSEEQIIHFAKMIAPFHEGFIPPRFY